MFPNPFAPRAKKDGDAPATDITQDKRNASMKEIF